MRLLQQQALQRRRRWPPRYPPHDAPVRPVPAIASSARPACLAMRRASGLANMRAPGSGAGGGRRRPIASGRCRGRRCRLRGRGCACGRRRYGRSGYLYAVESRCVLAFLQDQADDRIYSHPFGAGRHHGSCQGCPRRSPPPPSSPVGFDLAQDIAGGDLIPSLLSSSRHCPRSSSARGPASESGLACRLPTGSTETFEAPVVAG